MQHEQAVQNLAVECYLLGEMSPVERDAFEEHFFECEICAEDVRAASRFLEQAKELLREERASVVPAASREPAPREADAETEKRSGWSWGGWFRPQLAAAGLAMLAVVAGVETLVVIPGMRTEVQEATAPRLIQAQVLRPQTRGEAPVLRAAAGQAALLEFDLPDTTATRIRAVLESASGQTVLEVPETAVNAGSQISLSIPKLELPPGMYNLIIHSVPDGGSSGTELGRYPLQLQ